MIKRDSSITCLSWVLLALSALYNNLLCNVILVTRVVASPLTKANIILKAAYVR